MKMPQKPPDWPEILAEVSNGARLFEITQQTATRQYLHWDKLRHLNPPGGLTHREWWLSLKLQRRHSSRQVPLRDSRDQPFWYCLPDPILEQLHRIDQSGGGSIELPEQITNPNLRDRYVVSSLMEEAIRSSQLEGAATTRKIAKDMIRQGRHPRDRGEQMILNNYRAMQHIRGLRDQSLTLEMLLGLQEILTKDTLDDPSAAGRFHRADEPVHVVDTYGEIFHTPPPAAELNKRMIALCDFANGATPAHFVHPVIRSIVLHFWLAYDHPFVDGNGRCARALFYWHMLRSGYWLTEYISISEIIYRAPIQYYQAFLHTETDENDLTYFILYHLEVVQRAIEELHTYIKRKTEELRSLEKQLRLTAEFNHRQRALISHALRHSDAQYTFESHQRSHGVVYETARRDLLDLQQRGLLKSTKIGRTWYFSPDRELGRNLARLSS